MDPSADFEAHADRMMIRGGRLLGLGTGVAAVLWWPLDLLIFDAWPQTLRAFAIFRAGVFVGCVGGAWVLPSLAWARRRPAVVMTVAIAAVLAWIAFWMSSTVDGGWNSLAFLYLAPFATTIVVVPLRRRVLAVAAACAAVPLGWYLNPGRPLEPLIELITLSYLAFAAGAALLIGHGAYVLLRTVHRQAAELDSQRRELAEAARDLSRRVAERTAALSELRKHAQAAREQERRALGRDLHDGLGQELVAMRLAVSMARQQAGDAGESLALVEEQAVAAQSALRRLLADLRAALLDELGLVPAVRAMALEVGHAGGVDVSFDASALDGEVRAELGIALFRVAQEALNNVSRHAAATRVAVQLSGDEAEVRLAVLDDGIGMSSGAAPTDRYGLAGMQERMELLGGTLELGEGLGGGVGVHAAAPRVAPAEAWV